MRRKMQCAHSPHLLASGVPIEALPAKGCPTNSQTEPGFDAPIYTVVEEEWPEEHEVLLPTLHQEARATPSPVARQRDSPEPAAVEAEEADAATAHDIDAEDTVKALGGAVSPEGDAEAVPAEDVPDSEAAVEAVKVAGEQHDAPASQPQPEETPKILEQTAESFQEAEQQATATDSFPLPETKEEQAMQPTSAAVDVLQPLGKEQGLSEAILEEASLKDPSAAQAEPPSAAVAEGLEKAEPSLAMQASADQQNLASPVQGIVLEQIHALPLILALLIFFLGVMVQACN